MLYETNLKDIFNKVVVIVMKSLYKNIVHQEQLIQKLPRTFKNILVTLGFNTLM